MPILYTIILIHALQNIRALKKVKSKNKIEIRNNYVPSVKPVDKKESTTIKGCEPIQELNLSNIHIVENKQNNETNDKGTENRNTKLETSDSRISIYTIESSSENIDNKSCNKNENVTKLSRNVNSKYKQPSEWRAIKVVMVTSFAFVITLMPFFLLEFFYIICKYKQNSECEYLRTYLRGPLGMLAYSNSVLNPLIYAW